MFNFSWVYLRFGIAKKNFLGATKASLFVLCAKQQSCT